MRAEEGKRDVEDISGGEVRTGSRKVKKGKAQELDDIPVEAWIALGNKGVEFLVNFFNILLRGEKIAHILLKGLVNNNNRREDAR